MAKNKSTSFPFFQKIVKTLKKFIKIIYKNSRKHHRIFQSIQLTFIYFFASVVLLYTVKSSLGMLPEIMFKIIPYLSELLNFPVLKILATPEKTFILYLLILEMLINRSLFNFSLLVKFNVLLIFILEMFQNLIVSYWDLFFSRELDVLGGTTLVLKNAPIVFFTVFFFFFFILYMHSYIRGLQGLFPVLPGPLSRVTDSVGFWLQIKIPTGKKGSK